MLFRSKADKAVAVIEGVSAHHPGFLFMEFSKPQIGHAIKSHGRLGKGGGGKCGQGGERSKGDQVFSFDFPFG